MNNKLPKPITNRELQRQVIKLTELVEQLTDKLQEESNDVYYKTNELEKKINKIDKKMEEDIDNYNHSSFNNLLHRIQEHDDYNEVVDRNINKLYHIIDKLPNKLHKSIYNDLKGTNDR